METIRREGTVWEVEKGEVKIRIPRGGSCASCGGCGESGAEGETRAIVSDTGNIRPGDRVMLEGKAPGILSGALTLFILPLALLVAGFTAGPALAAQLPGSGIDSELAGGILGGCGLLLPYLALFLRRLYNRRRGRYELRIVQLLGSDPNRGQAS